MENILIITVVKGRERHAVIRNAAKKVERGNGMEGGFDGDFN